MLGALAASMLTFIVFVFSILLVAVQLASAQLTPRIIAVVYRAPVLKLSLTFFVFTFTFTLGVLGRINDTVPQVAMWVAVYSNVVSHRPVHLHARPHRQEPAAGEPAHQGRQPRARR